MEIAKDDIFYTNWGYDQTQYDFIKVISVSKTGKTAICKRVKVEIVKAHRTQDEVKPNGKAFGDTFRMQVRHGDEISLRGSYPFIYDGKVSRGTRLDSFFKWDGERAFWETNPMFGH